VYNMSFGYVNPNPVFRPQLMYIAAISQSNPGVVTTTTNHNYDSGLIVRLLVPFEAGMTQLNKQSFSITVLSPNTFSIPIDTSFFDAFVFPANPEITSPQVVAFAEDNDVFTMAMQNVLN
jgi:hypothetical protein